MAERTANSNEEVHYGGMTISDFSQDAYLGKCVKLETELLRYKTKP